MSCFIWSLNTGLTIYGIMVIMSDQIMLDEQSRTALEFHVIDNLTEQTLGAGCSKYRQPNENVKTSTR